MPETLVPGLTALGMASDAVTTPTTTSDKRVASPQSAVSDGSVKRAKLEGELTPPAGITPPAAGANPMVAPLLQAIQQQGAHIHAHTHVHDDDEDEDDDLRELQKPDSSTVSMLATASQRRILKGSSCHQCKNTKPLTKLAFCCNTFSKRTKTEKRVCRKKLCEQCLRKFYNIELDAVVHEPWICTSCQGICVCAACLRHMQRKRSQHTNMPMNMFDGQHAMAAQAAAGMYPFGAAMPYYPMMNMTPQNMAVNQQLLAFQQNYAAAMQHGLQFNPLQSMGMAAYPQAMELPTAKPAQQQAAAASATSAPAATLASLASAKVGTPLSTGSQPSVPPPALQFTKSSSSVAPPKSITLAGPKTLRPASSIASGPGSVSETSVTLPLKLTPVTKSPQPQSLPTLASVAASQSPSLPPTSAAMPFRPIVMPGGQAQQFSLTRAPMYNGSAAAGMDPAQYSMYQAAANQALALQQVGYPMAMHQPTFGVSNVGMNAMAFQPFMTPYEAAAFTQTNRNALSLDLTARVAK